MKTRGICFFDLYSPPVPPEYFVTHYVPERLRPRFLTHLYTQRPELPRLHTHGSIQDIPAGVFLDVHGMVFAANLKVSFTTKRGYKVATFLSHAHAVCAQLREGAYITVDDKKGKPFVIVPGMRHGAVLYLDDVKDIADAFAARAVEGATLYEGSRSQAIADGHLYDGRRAPRLGASLKAALSPATYPPGTRVRVVTESRPDVATGEVIEEGWGTRGGCKVRHDDEAVYGWGWSELAREDAIEQGVGDN